MNRKELVNVLVCGMCGKTIGESGLPFFYRIRIERHGIKADAVRRHFGLATMLGSEELADIMGPGEELTQSVMTPRKLTVCEPCSMKRTIVAHLAEQGKPEGEPSEEEKT